TLGQLEPPCERVPTAGLCDLVDELFNHETVLVVARCAVARSRDMRVDHVLFVTAMRYLVRHRCNRTYSVTGPVWLTDRTGEPGGWQAITAERRAKAAPVDR